MKIGGMDDLDIAFQAAMVKEPLFSGSSGRAHAESVS
jgi:hypothetical protein